MAKAKNVWDALLDSETVRNEAALTAYTMSRIFPIVIENCREIDPSIATDIIALFGEYAAYTKELIDSGTTLVETGTEELSSTEINRKIDASIEEVKNHFEDPKNRHSKTCEAYKKMLEFDLMFKK